MRWFAEEAGPIRRPRPHVARSTNIRCNNGKERKIKKYAKFYKNHLFFFIAYQSQVIIIIIDNNCNKK